MIRRLLLLARGQVRLRVTGASLPRFLNVCAQNGLTLRHMKRTAWNELYGTLSVQDFRALRGCMGRTGCRVHIVRRAGAPFVAARVWPRRALWGGFLLLLLLCWVVSTRIWAIETNIDASLPRAELMEQLDELGVRIGVRRNALNVKQIRWKLLQRMPDVSFFSLNILGNRLTVEARGSVPLPELLDTKAVVKVVASREGVVKSMNVREGEPLAAPGDAVQVGDTLISALVPPRTETGLYRLAHARGSVQAYTAYDITAARALTTGQKTYTGKVKHQYALVFGKKRLNLYFGSGISGGTCDKIVETKTVWLSDSVVFPVSLVCQTYRYFDLTPAAAAPEDVSGDMTERALARITDGMDGEVTAHEQTVREQDGAAVLHLTADALEQIGVEALDDSEIPETPPPPAE